MQQPKPVVLVVEDEPIMLLHAIDIVDAAGFEVLSAGDATEAVRILESRLDIRVVFSDIDMPRGIDGMRLAALIRDRWPPIKIILTSGYHEEKDVQLPAHSTFFSKPYEPGEIIDEIRRMAA